MYVCPASPLASVEQQAKKIQHDTTQTKLNTGTTHTTHTILYVEMKESIVEGKLANERMANQTTGQWWMVH
jgi:hypothetical protein